MRHRNKGKIPGPKHNVITPKSRKGNHEMTQERKDYLAAFFQHDVEDGLATILEEYNDRFRVRRDMISSYEIENLCERNYSVTVFGSLLENRIEIWIGDLDEMV